MYKKMNLKISQFENCESIIYITEDFSASKDKFEMAGEVLIILVR